MIRNPHLARSMADAGWSEFRRTRKYRTQRRGSQFAIAPRSYPSTKTGSARGTVKAEISLGEHVFQCEPCGRRATGA